jgi:hypothetical protein
MALSTTQSIWRSGGGDQTRISYCGTGVMAAQFFIPSVAVASATNVKVSSVSGAPELILPAGAVVTEILFTVDNGTGETDIGFTLYDTGTNTPAGLADNATNTRNAINLNTTGGTSLAVPMSLTERVYITARAGGSAGTGSMTGTIMYYVTDPLVGQQNV